MESHLNRIVKCAEHISIEDAIKKIIASLELKIGMDQNFIKVFKNTDFKALKYKKYMMPVYYTFIGENYSYWTQDTLGYFTDNDGYVYGTVKSPSKHVEKKHNYTRIYYKKKLIPDFSLWDDVDYNSNHLLRYDKRDCIINNKITNDLIVKNSFLSEQDIEKKIRQLLMLSDNLSSDKKHTFKYKYDLVYLPICIFYFEYNGTTYEMGVNMRTGSCFVPFIPNKHILTNAEKSHKKYIKNYFISLIISGISSGLALFNLLNWPSRDSGYWLLPTLCLIPCALFFLVVLLVFSNFKKAKQKYIDYYKKELEEKAILKRNKFHKIKLKDVSSAGDTLILVIICGIVTLVFFAMILITTLGNVE